MEQCTNLLQDSILHQAGTQQVYLFYRHFDISMMLTSSMNQFHIDKIAVARRIHCAPFKYNLKKWCNMLTMFPFIIFWYLFFQVLLPNSSANSVMMKLGWKHYSADFKEIIADVVIQDIFEQPNSCDFDNSQAMYIAPCTIQKQTIQFPIEGILIDHQAVFLKMQKLEIYQIEISSSFITINVNKTSWKSFFTFDQHSKMKCHVRDQTQNISPPLLLLMTLNFGPVIYDQVESEANLEVRLM